MRVCVGAHVSWYLCVACVCHALGSLCHHDGQSGSFITARPVALPQLVSVCSHFLVSTMCSVEAALHTVHHSTLH